MSTGLVRRAKALRLSHSILKDEKREKELADLILALERQSSQIEGLTKQELQMVLGEKSSNVLPLHQKKKINHFKIFSSIIDQRYVIQTPCLLEGQDSYERRKVAFEIHSRTQRVAFLDFKLDLLEVTDCTLFVEELLHLSAEDQNQIKIAIKENRAPLIISGTEHSLSQLRASSLIDNETLSLLSAAHFRLQHPLKHYLEHGFFKLFLESLC